jgi:HlyD family secretion protein
MKNTFLILFIVSSFFFIGCNSQTETITPKTADVVESVYASGIVKSKNQYEVFTMSSGVVEKIFVNEGEQLQKGTPLLKIENTNSALSTESARLISLANDYKLNKEKLVEAKNNIELAQKRLKNDSLLYVRQQSLWNQNIGSKVELDQKGLNFESARVNLKKAQVSYEDINRQLKLVSDQSKYNLKLAQANEKEFMIRSKEDGYVYKLYVETGELATSMSPLAIIGQKEFILELKVDEFDIFKIRKGQKLIVRMDSYKNQVFEAAVSFIYPMMEERTRTFKVEAVFINPPEKLYPNLTLEASIIINEKKNVLMIPSNYLWNDSNVILEDGTVKAVKIGLKDYDMAEVLSGLDKETKIRLPEN